MLCLHRQINHKAPFFTSHWLRDEVKILRMQVTALLCRFMFKVLRRLRLFSSIKATWYFTGDWCGSCLATYRVVHISILPTPAALFQVCPGVSCSCCSILSGFPSSCCPSGRSDSAECARLNKSHAVALLLLWHVLPVRHVGWLAISRSLFPARSKRADMQGQRKRDHMRLGNISFSLTQRKKVMSQHFLTVLHQEQTTHLIYGLHQSFKLWLWMIILPVQSGSVLKDWRDRKPAI